MSVSNNPNISVNQPIGGVTGADTEKTTTVSGAPAPKPTPAAFRSAAAAPRAAGPRIGDAVKEAIDGSPNTPPRNNGDTPPPGGNTRKSISAIRNDRDMNLEQKLDALANTRTPPEERAALNSAAKTVFFDAFGKAVAFSQTVGGEESINLNNEIVARHHLVLTSVETLLESNDPKEIDRAVGQLRTDIAFFLEMAADGPVKDEALKAAETLMQIGGSRSRLVAAVDDAMPRLAELTGDGTPPSVGNLAEYAQTMNNLDAMTLRPAADGGPPREMLLVDDSRLEAVVRSGCDLADKVAEKGLGNADLVAPASDDEPFPTDTFKKAAEVVGRRLNDSAATGLTQSAGKIENLQQLLKADTALADQHLGKLTDLKNSGLTGTYGDFDAVSAAFHEALRADGHPIPGESGPAANLLYLTSESRARFDQGLKDARELYDKTAASFESRSLEDLGRALEKDFPDGVRQANALLGRPGLRDEFRAKIATTVADAFAARHEKSLEEINRLNASLKELTDQFAADETSGTKGRKASAADRTEVAERIEKLQAAIETAQARLDADADLFASEGATGRLGEARDGIRDGLAAARERVDQVGNADLAKSRLALGILRFTQKLTHRVSIGIAMNKGVPGMVEMLAKCDLPRATIDDLANKLASGTLTMEERALLAGQLRNVFTHSQQASEPMNTALNRLASENPSVNLSAADRGALRAGMNMLVSREDAADLQVQIVAASKESLPTHSGRATKVVDDAKAAAARLAAGGDDPADRKTVANFGDRMAAVMAQAKSSLTVADYNALVESTRTGRAEVADGIMAALVKDAGDAAATLTPEQRAFARETLVAGGFNTKATGLLLSSGKIPEVMDAASGDDPAAIGKAWDSVLGDHPDLDDLCLDLKKTRLEGGALAERTDPNQIRRIDQAHESDRLVRACKVGMENAVLFRPALRETRRELLTLPNDQFLARFGQTLGVAGNLDLFVIRAMWLDRCSKIEGEVPAGEFADFQSELPAPYAGRANLMREIRGDLASTAEMDACQDMVDGLASQYDRSRLSHWLLDLLGTVLNKTLTQADLMDGLIDRMSRPAHHYDANTVKNGLLSEGLGVRNTRSLDVDGNNLSMMTPQGDKAGLSFKEKVLRMFHVISRTTDFSNLPTQMNRVAERTSPAPIREVADASQEREALEGRHGQAMELVVAQLDPKKRGAGIQDGVTMSITVLAIDVSISDKHASWQVRQANMRSLAPLKSKLNILSMEQGQDVSYLTPEAKQATDEFREAFNALRNAGTKEAFEAAEERMAKIAHKYRLNDRAQAVLVYLPEGKSGVDSKLSNSLKKKPTEGFKAQVRRVVEPLYKSRAAKVQSLADAEKRARGEGERHNVRYYMSDAVSTSFRNAATVELLDRFEKTHPPVGFADFVKAFAKGEPASVRQEALTELTEAFVQVGQDNVPRENAAVLAEYFLTEAVNQYLWAAGGPEAKLSEQVAGIKDPDNLRYLDKQFKEHKESALAIRNGLRDLKLDDMFANLHQGGEVVLSTSRGIEVEYDDIAATASIENGITIQRGHDNTYSLVLSKGMAAGLSASFSAAADILTASIEVGGHHSWGYQLDFTSEQACKDFVSALLSGESKGVATDPGTKLSVITSTGVKVEANASIGIGKKIDELTEKIESARAFIDRSRGGEKDLRRKADLELSAEFAASLARDSVRSGRIEEKTYKMEARATIEGKAKLGADNEILDAEMKFFDKSFGVEMKTIHSVGRMTGASMTRNFEFSSDSTPEEVEATLADYGVVNPGLVGFVMDKVKASGGPVNLAIEARMSAFAMGEFEKIDIGGIEGFARQSMFMCSRSNYDVGEVRVTVPEKGGSISVEHQLKEAAEDGGGDDETADATDDGRGSSGVISTLADRVETIRDSVSERLDEGRQLVTDRAADLAGDLVGRMTGNAQLAERANQLVSDQVGSLVGLGGGEAELGFFDKVSVGLKIDATGSASRTYRFPVAAA